MKAILPSVIEQITTERNLQDEQWGGESHDDSHSSFEFREFIEKQLSFITDNPEEFVENRNRLIKVAALAIAAIESIDRRRQ